MLSYCDISLETWKSCMSETDNLQVRTLLITNLLHYLKYNVEADPNHISTKQHTHHSWHK